MTSAISYSKFDKRIVIHPVRSQRLLILVFSLHVVALLMLFFIDLYFLFLLILSGLILFSLYRFTISEKLITHGLSLQQGERLLFQENETLEWLDVDLLESFVSRWLVIIKIRTMQGSKNHALVYMSDSICHQSFRHLIVFLNGYRELE